EGLQKPRWTPGGVDLRLGDLQEPANFLHGPVCLHRVFLIEPKNGFGRDFSASFEGQLRRWDSEFLFDLKAFLVARQLKSQGTVEVVKVCPQNGNIAILAGGLLETRLYDPATETLATMRLIGDHAADGSNLENKVRCSNDEGLEDRVGKDLIILSDNADIVPIGCGQGRRVLVDDRP